MKFEDAVEEFRDGLWSHKPTKANTEEFSLVKRQNASSNIIPVCKVKHKGHEFTRGEGKDACKKAMDEAFDLMEFQKSGKSAKSYEFEAKKHY